MMPLHELPCDNNLVNHLEALLVCIRVSREPRDSSLTPKNLTASKKATYKSGAKAQARVLKR